ncbi:MAG TPA: phosphotransferase family protein [Nocardioidaceae bacterium]|nr:phosphotransferase family protein [Nocardioidaceae bacterium]
MDRSPVPGAGPVRDEDAFDVPAVAAWLRTQDLDADLAADLAAEPEVRQFSGGASNLTYLLRYPARDLVLRRPPAGQKAAGAHDMRRELTIQSRLRPVFPYVPRMIAHCDDRSVVGSDFYVMERVEGTILGRDLPSGTNLSESGVRRLCTGVLDRLVELHSVDAEAAGLGDLGRGHGYVGRQVAGWSERFRRARTEDVGDFEAVMAWLDEHRPEDVGSCVIHNDYRFDNVVLDEDLEVRGVLDWEMATLGDPLMDLGGALAYWVEAGDDEVFQQFRRQPTHLSGMLTRAEVVEYYTGRTGLSVSPAQWTFYEVFGLFRLAVIAQQIYYRYVHGQTTNEAFAVFGPAVQYLEQRCKELAR